jgi:hypothetical protein
VKKNLLIALGVVVAIALTACAAIMLPTVVGGQSAQPSASPSANPIPTPTPTPVEYAPIAGVEVTPGSLEHPVLMAKIDNNPDARPQIGLNQADIVFEELVEGGLSRYLAVWHSVIPTKIGPIRSIRPMDPDIASPFKGLITYSGGQYRFVMMMIHTKVKNVIHGTAGTQKYVYRTDSLIAPHNVLVRAHKLVESKSRLAPPAPAFEFAHDGSVPTAVAVGKLAGRLVTSFSGGNSPSWKFNAAAGVYRRFQAGGAKDTDERKKQLTATNVIAQLVNESSEYGYVPRAHVVGKGVAWISTGGSTVKARWSKRNRASMTIYKLPNGDAVTLAPGRTWIELVPNTTGYFQKFRR